MENAIIIKNADDPRVSEYRSLKVRHPEKDDIFIVESKPIIKTLLQTNLEVISCLTTHSVYDEFRTQVSDSLKKEVPFYLMEKSQIEDIIGFRFHQGIMAAVKSPKKMSIKDRMSAWPSPHQLVALNGVHDPQNVGLIIRNAAAFGTDTLIVDGKSYEPFYRKVVRISMGSIFNIPLAYETDLLPVFQSLKKNFGTKIVVTSPDNNCQDVHTADLSGNICLVLGNEFSGVSREIMDIADLSVKIPLFFDKADSLNVASASAIFLYEISRQRNTH